MFKSIKFFIRDRYYALINHLWRKLYRAEHYKFVDEYLRKQVPIDGATYWKELINCYKEET